MNVFVVDRRYPRTTIPQGVTTVWVNSNDSLASVAARVVEAVRTNPTPNARIDLLVLAGHGNAGYVQIGTGLTEASARELAPIRRYMSTTPRRRAVEVHGCGVASSTNILGPGSTITQPNCVPGRATAGDGPGFALLRALARALGSSVRAGINCEYADPNWVFEGPTVTVAPNRAAVIEYAHAD